MKLLIIDTSLDYMGVAITDGQEVKYENVILSQRKHSESIMIEINHAFKESNISPESLDAVVVTNGPGSYTGIRIGVTIAKVLAYTLNIPVIPISSLQAFSLYVKCDDKQLIMPVFDARGNTVYAGVYDCHHKLVEADKHYKISDINNKVNNLKEKVIIIGNGVELLDVDDVKVVNKVDIKPSLIGIFATELSTVNPHLLKPNYLKLIEAEIKFNNGEFDD